MREVGFEVIEFRDLVKDGDKPWYGKINLFTNMFSHDHYYCI